ncbi:putative toxin-antitoxin system toxin component, PIN family [Thermococcus sp. MAR1]|uniref:putative toxin-antitoxin system toxin component, PIN family n=1 Tax=Thermococcus sp. MAR1 TaxID=1638263 RepID=UPI001F0F4F64|nr:putative toxin-antitoxin system toxin component, PIN family [Thermococcus sp. MAR1]
MRVVMDTNVVLARYLKGSVVIPSFETFNFSRNPDDNKWLGIAYKAKAEYILTWDKDLLELRGRQQNSKPWNPRRQDTQADRVLS